MSDAQQLVNTMKKILLATVAIVAFSAPSFAAETAKTVGQAPPSFYLAQDCACRKSNPNILMMQSAEDWAAKNVASSLNTA
jgi:hypothetical protein